MAFFDIFSPNNELNQCVMQIEVKLLSLAWEIMNIVLASATNIAICNQRKETILLQLAVYLFFQWKQHLMADLAESVQWEGEQEVLSLVCQLQQCPLCPLYNSPLWKLTRKKSWNKSTGMLYILLGGIGGKFIIKWVRWWIEKIMEDFNTGLILNPPI